MIKSLAEEFPSALDRVYASYKASIHVEDIMTRNVATVASTASMLEAAKIMAEKRIGSLIVEEKGVHLGIVTERDLLAKVMAMSLNPKDVRVEEVMSWPLISVKPIDSIKDAARMMIRKKGKLVVEEGHRAVGIVSASDIIRRFPECPETRRAVDQFMTKQIVAVANEATVEEAVRVMAEKRIGSVLVGKPEQLEGIFTEKDLVANVVAKENPLNKPVSAFASKPLHTIPPQTTVHEAAKRMGVGRIRRLGITPPTTKKLLGIITARDLVEAYVM